MKLELIDSVYNVYQKTNKWEVLTAICREEKSQQLAWSEWINNIGIELGIEITCFPLHNDLNPSLIAVFLSEEYQRPKPLGYQPLQLILKISVIAPVYMLYFDNFDSSPNKRLMRVNPISDKEKTIFEKVKMDISITYPKHEMLDFSDAYISLYKLNNISESNNRKPYLDECLFGLYLSIHPHNINIDQPQSGASMQR